MLSGDNGVLQRATDAKTKSDEAQIRERIQLTELSARTDGKGDLAYSKLNDELTKEFGAKGTGYTISDEDAEIWTIKVGNVEYNIENSTHITPNTSQKLVDIVKKGDYGKSIDYSVTVNGKTLNNWKVFLNDKSNVYIILGEYLDVSLVPSSTGLQTDSSNYKYSVWSSNSDTFLNGLITTSYWEDFARGINGATATGSPTKEQLEASYGNTVDIDSSISGDLYVLETDYENNCSSYWLATYISELDTMPMVSCESGRIYGDSYNYLEFDDCGIRPLVKLPSDTTGSINATVTIDK